MENFDVYILAFDDMELLDFAGPYEVFSLAAQFSEKPVVKVKAIAFSMEPVRSINGLKILPECTPAEIGNIDLFVIPGGTGSKKVLSNPQWMQVIQRIIEISDCSMSVCSGARIFAALGHLDGKKYSTHHLVYDDVEALAQGAIPGKGMRFCDEGKIMTSAGIAAGIDLSFYAVEKFLGRPLKEKIEAFMEYPAK
ncbi:MAG: DJ-1/PfpI family protein [Cyclobacteriaceae bacterium]|nr:DJ-1/PfpI family protein [Cyclobacteriaceae bacterium]